MQIVNKTIPPRLVVPSHTSKILSMKYILELVYFLADLVPFKDSEVVLNMADRLHLQELSGSYLMDSNFQLNMNNRSSFHT
jgi:hypothetical protein